MMHVTRRGIAAGVAALFAAAALAQTGSSGSVSLDSGPHKGAYDFAPTETCFINAFGKKALGLSVVMNSQESSLSIDMPNLDEKHSNEIQIVLVIAEKRAGKATSSVTYEIDTRPDAVLEPFQKAERAHKGMTGKAVTTLMQKGDSAMLTFTGQTATGVKLEGSVTCRRVVQESRLNPPARRESAA
jgi:hypothetical protein